MVNVHIHQFKALGPLVDADAMEQFQRQWATYQKLVDADWLSHKAVGQILGSALNERFTRPFPILDIACGDASLMRRVLPGTTVGHYHGVDLAEPALELAARNLADVAFEIDLDHRDFGEAMNDRPEPADVSWCSLSIHHLPTEDKLRLLKAIRAATSTFMLMYEPARRNDEDRGGVPRPLRPNQSPDLDYSYHAGMEPDRTPCADRRSAGDERRLARSRPAGRLLRGHRSLRRSDGPLPPVSLRRVSSSCR